jgi:NCS1 family nucleobase:cation symporter-1
VYIFTWLGFYGGALGAIAGVLIADYWFMRSTNLKLGDLYRVNGEYKYSAGFNWRGLVSLLVIGPLYSWFPFHVYDYSWVVGLVAASVCYLALSALFPATGAARARMAAAT